MPPLVKQNVSVAFTGGLETKSDPKQVISSKLLALTNGVFTAPGRIQKRNGYATLGSALGNIPGSALLTQYGSETVASDGTSLYSWSSTLNAWENKGTCMSIGVSRDVAVRQRPGVSCLSTAVNGNIACHVYFSNITWNNTNKTTVGVYYTIKDLATGQILVNDQTLESGTVVWPSLKVVAVGTYFIVLYQIGGHWVYRNINRASLAVSAAVNIFAATKADVLDACYEPVNNKVVMACTAAGGTNAGLATFDTTGSLALSAGTAYTGVFYCIGIWADATNGNCGIGYCLQSTGVIYVWGINPATLADVWAPAICETYQSSQITGYMANNVGKVYYNNVPSAGLGGIRQTPFSSGTPGAAALFVRNIELASKPVLVGSTRYLIGYHTPLTANAVTYYLISTSGYVPARIAQEDGAMYSGQFTLNNPGYYALQDIYSLGNSQYYTGIGVASKTIASLNGTFGNTTGLTFDTGADGLTFDFVNGTNRYQSAQLANVLHVNGGLLQMYDGAQVVEHGFHHAPVLGLTNGGGGGSLTSGLYQWVAVFEWTDAQGNTHQSAPSNVVSENSAWTKATLTIETLGLSAKANVIIRIYRTLVNGTVFYMVNELDPLMNDATAQSVTYTDGTADTAISSQPLLYTSQQVPASPGPPCSVLGVYRNRLLLVASERPLQLWYSLQVVPGQPAQMSDQLIQNLDPTDGPMSALAVMDDKLLIFKPNVTFYMTGDGPDATGANNNFSTPIIINTNTGCPYPRSTVTGDEGVMYQSAKGIWLLGRGLQESYIGEGVEPTVLASQVIAANIIPFTNEVRFELASATLVWDYFMKQWSIFTYPGYLSHSAAALIGNVYAFLRSIDGQIYQETPGTYSDAGTAIATSLTTSWLQFAGPQGFQRIYKFNVLGDFFSNHSLSVQIAYDYNPAIVQTDTITVTSGGPEQYRVFPAKQKCQAMQITLSDAPSPVGKGAAFSGLSLEVGAKRGIFKLPAASSVG